MEEAHASPQFMDAGKGHNEVCAVEGRVSTENPDHATLNFAKLSQIRPLHHQTNLTASCFCQSAYPMGHLTNHCNVFIHTQCTTLSDQQVPNSPPQALYSAYNVSQSTNKANWSERGQTRLDNGSRKKGI